ncbi:MAG TPA: hypothetical protein VHW09_27030 [Bryobacteraceae bacterium]|jgi:hypothetical protein|nr:hypothetical protein [Bryobacteraceae bacterium]
MAFLAAIVKFAAASLLGAFVLYLLFVTMLTILIEWNRQANMVPSDDNDA